jgi:hypothetical protein
LPASCCQPVVAGGGIYGDLWGELSTHLNPQALLLRFLLCVSLCYKLSPFQALGKVTLHLRVYLQFTWEVGLPSSPVKFSSLCHSHQLSCSWLLGARPAPARASLARPACLFTAPGRIPFPKSLELRAPHPFSCVSYLFLLLITQFLFYPGVEVSLSRGLCCSGSGLSVGEPRYRKAHLVRVFPSLLGAGDWRPRGPPCFSV